MDLDTINNMTAGDLRRFIVSVLQDPGAQPKPKAVSSVEDLTPPIHSAYATVVGGTFTTTSTNYVDWQGALGAVLEVAHTKRSVSTVIYVTYHTSFYLTAAGSVKFAVRVDGSPTYESVSPHFQNEATSHKGYSNTIRITGLDATPHTYRFRIKVVTGAGSFAADLNDYGTLIVQEVYE